MLRLTFEKCSAKRKPEPLSRKGARTEEFTLSAAQPHQKRRSFLPKTVKKDHQNVMGCRSIYSVGGGVDRGGIRYTRVNS